MLNNRENMKEILLVIQGIGGVGSEIQLEHLRETYAKP